MVKENIFVKDISIIAPGLSDKEEAGTILRGKAQWSEKDLPVLQPGMLQANERRRVTPLIKIALQTLQPLLKEGEDTNGIAMVFASSDGDLGIVDKICQALATTEKMVSPTLFHNSVHNAPAGYWAIAASMQGASVSMSAGDATFAAGLLDAYTQVLTEKNDVLFVAYDVAAPQPLDKVRHFDYSMAIAMRLSAEPGTETGSSLNMSLASDKLVSECANASLAGLKKANPVGAGLPLFETIVKNEQKEIVLPYIMQQQLVVVVDTKC